MPAGRGDRADLTLALARMGSPSSSQLLMQEQTPWWVESALSRTRRAKSGLPRLGGIDGEAGVGGGFFEGEGVGEFFGEVELEGVAVEIVSHPLVGGFVFGGEDDAGVVGEAGDVGHVIEVSSERRVATDGASQQAMVEAMETFIKCSRHCHSAEALLRVRCQRTKIRKIVL